MAFPQILTIPLIIMLLGSLITSSVAQECYYDYYYYDYYCSHTTNSIYSSIHSRSSTPYKRNFGNGLVSLFNTPTIAGLVLFVGCIYFGPCIAICIVMVCCAVIPICPLFIYLKSKNKSNTSKTVTTAHYVNRTNVPAAAAANTNTNTTVQHASNNLIAYPVQKENDITIIANTVPPSYSQVNSMPQYSIYPQQQQQQYVYSPVMLHEHPPFNPTYNPHIEASYPPVQEQFCTSPRLQQ